MTQTSENLTFLSGPNAEYIAQLYGEFLSDPGKVDESWKEFFSGLNDDESALLQELSGASWTPEENSKASRRFGMSYDAPANDMAQPHRRAGDKASQEDVKQAASDSIAALMLIRSYRVRGHLMADLDPLGMKEKGVHPELEPSHYGFGSEDLNRPIYIGGVLGMEYASVNEIVTALKQTYCSTIGVDGWYSLCRLS